MSSLGDESEGVMAALQFLNSCTLWLQCQTSCVFVKNRIRGVRRLSCIV